MIGYKAIGRLAVGTSRLLKCKCRFVDDLRRTDAETVRGRVSLFPSLFLSMGQSRDKRFALFFGSSWQFLARSDLTIVQVAILSDRHMTGDNRVLQDGIVADCHMVHQ